MSGHDQGRRRYGRNNVADARELRQPTTAAETVLWDALRDRRLDGPKFRRQHPVGPFVLDFCCPTFRLAVEVDGAVHDDQTEEDAERERSLTAAGYRFLRLRNEDILTNLPAAIASIRHAITAENPPLPVRGRGGRG